MNNDKMRAEFEAWAVENLPYSLERSKFNGEYKWPQVTMHFETYKAGRKESQAEVERLRAQLDQLCKDWCDDDEAIKQQALRVLDAAKVEGDSWSVPRMGSLAEMMTDELLKVRAELAAAKAPEREANGQVFRPPLDLPAPKGKEAEWALLRLAEVFVVERKHETWDELANAIAAASVCPVKFDGVYANSADEAVVWFEETGKAEPFVDWLRQLKERREQ